MTDCREERVALALLAAAHQRACNRRLDPAGSLHVVTRPAGIHFERGQPLNRRHDTRERAANVDRRRRTMTVARGRDQRRNKRVGAAIVRDEVCRA